MAIGISHITSLLLAFLFSTRWLFTTDSCDEKAGAGLFQLRVYRKEGSGMGFDSILLPLLMLWLLLSICSSEYPVECVHWMVIIEKEMAGISQEGKFDNRRIN